MSFIDQIRKLRPESHILTPGDRQLAGSLWDLEGIVFAKVFAQKVATNRGVSEPSDLRSYILKVLKENSSLISIGKVSLDEMQDLNDEAFYALFKKRILGYTEDDHKKLTNELRASNTQVVRDIEAFIGKLDTILGSLNHKSDKGKRLYLEWIRSHSRKNLDLILSRTDESYFAIEAASKLFSRSFFAPLTGRLATRAADSLFSFRIDKTFGIFPLTFENPLRHAIWFTVPVYDEIQHVMATTGLPQKAVVIIEQSMSIVKIFESDIRNGLFENRYSILMEALNSYSHGLFTASYTLLATQIEGILFDLAERIEGKIYKGTPVHIFENSSRKEFFNISTNRIDDSRSIEHVLFKSQMAQLLDPMFLEFFASDFYKKRCMVAHGEINCPIAEHEVKLLMLFFHSVCHQIDEVNEKL